MHTGDWNVPSSPEDYVADTPPRSDAEHAVVPVTADDAPAHPLVAAIQRRDALRTLPGTAELDVVIQHRLADAAAPQNTDFGLLLVPGLGSSICQTAGKAAARGTSRDSVYVSVINTFHEACSDLAVPGR